MSNQEKNRRSFEEGMIIDVSAETVSSETSHGPSRKQAADDLNGVAKGYVKTYQDAIEAYARKFANIPLARGHDALAHAGGSKTALLLAFGVVVVPCAALMTVNSTLIVVAAGVYLLFSP